MNAQLVKIDVAAAQLGWSAAKLFDLVEGGTLLEAGFEWVFNLANDPKGERRDLRFWMYEVAHRADPGSKLQAPSSYELSGVINTILPPARRYFHAGEVDQLFQIRPRTRIDLHDELAGSLNSGRNQYARADLAAFLKRRHISATTFATKLTDRSGGGSSASHDAATDTGRRPASSQKLS
ncbi:MAG: hypothetical protein WCH99_10165 [Verrucomicrobiota bacterium]|jgi:hypothetical protein